MHSRSPSRPLFARLLIAALLLAPLALLARPGRAAAQVPLGTTYTWTGAVDSSWFNGGNWSPNGVPGSGSINSSPEDRAIFPSGPSRRTVNAPAPITIKQLTFQADYSLNGSTFTVGSGGISMSVSASLTTTIASNMTITRTVPLTVSNSLGTLWLLSSASGPGGFSKAGTGKLLLGSAADTSTYTGPTTVSAGTLAVLGNTALGGTGGGTTVVQGGTLLLLAPALTIAEPLTLDGTAAGLGGRLIANDGVQSLTGPLTLTGTGGRVIPNNTSVIRLEGLVSGSGPLAKTGEGDLVIAGNSANTNTGLTSVGDGRLLLNKSPGVAALGGDLVVGNSDPTDQSVVQPLAANQLKLGATVMVFERGELFLGSQVLTIQDLQLQGGSVQATPGSAALLRLNGELRTTASTLPAALGANLAIVQATLPISVADGTADPDLQLGAAISGSGGLTKLGPGTLAIFKPGSYAGQTRVQEGVLRVAQGATLGNLTGGTLVLGSGQLQLDDDAIISETLALGGSGPDGSGALFSLRPPTGTSTARVRGAVTLRPGEVVVGAGTSTQLELSAAVGGSGQLVKAGSGILVLNGPSANTYTGGTLIREGELVLDKRDGVVAVPGALNVGNGSGPDNLTIRSNEQIANTAPVTVSQSAVMDLSGHTERIGNLTLQGSAVASPTSLVGTLVVAGTITTLPSSFSAMIADRLVLTGARTVNVAEGAAADDLRLVEAVGGTGGLVKQGPGTLVLSGFSANTYQGGTFVREGTLALNKSNGLAAIPGPLTLGTNGDSKDNPDQVILRADNQIADTAVVTATDFAILRLEGKSDALAGLVLGNAQVETIPPGGGATGVLSLVGGVRTVAENGGAVIDGALALGNTAHTFTIAADGPLLVDAVISGDGGLVKDGLGVMVLEQPNSYGGGTLVRAGTLSILNVGALGTTAAGTRVLAGASLEVRASAGVIVEPLTLNGLGFENSGALTTRSARTAPQLLPQATDQANQPQAGNTMSWSGPITLGAGQVGINAANTDGLKLEQIAGSGGLTKLGTGTLTLEGATANTFAGPTDVQEGTLLLNKTGVVAIPGSLAVGQNLPTGAVAALLLQPTQLADTSQVTVRRNGTFNTGGFDQTIGGLALSGGLATTVSQGFTGTLVINGNIAALVAPVPSIIRGGLFLPPGAHAINVADGAALDDLALEAGVGGASFTKMGTGRLVLSSANTYTGATTVSAGTLLVASPGGSATSSGNVVVDSGATLAGSGSLAGSVVIRDGGTLAPGREAGEAAALSMAGLNLAPTAKLQLDVGIPGDAGTMDQLTAAGNVLLDGVLNIRPSQDFGAGSYPFLLYGGTLSTRNGELARNALTIGRAPTGFTYRFNAATTGQVTLVVS